MLPHKYLLEIMIILVIFGHEECYFIFYFEDILHFRVIMICKLFKMLKNASMTSKVNNGNQYPNKQKNLYPKCLQLLKKD